MGSTVSDSPNTHDLGQLAMIYLHNDAVTSGGGPGPGGGRGGGRGGGGGVNLPPPAMGEIDFESPAQWGRLVSTTADGRGQTYELDFGGGFRLATHVYWADPTRAPRP